MLIGYSNRFSVAPGEGISFMVSADIESAEASLVRLFHGDQRSPVGLVEREVASSLDGVWPLEDQVVIPGSFGLIECSDHVGEAVASQLSGHLFVYPTLLERSAPQGLLAHQGDARAGAWELVLERGGDLVVRAFDGSEVGGCVRLRQALRQGAWHSVSFTFDRVQGSVQAWTTPLDGLNAGATRQAKASIQTGVGVSYGQLLLAARRLVRGFGEPRASDTFNGKIERPTLFAGVLTSVEAGELAGGVDPGRLSPNVLLDLDLGTHSDGWRLRDRSPLDHAGRLYNAPLRSCTSHEWRGETVAPALAPGSYAAVHFHDDDVEHANWQPVREWTVPEGFGGGIYAVRLRGGGVEDRIPFIVRPPRDRASEEVALWLPSFTYAAYANARECLAGQPYGQFDPETPDGDHLLDDHPEWGGSTYDVHPDGSGIAISSLARPVPNLRPTHRPGLVNAPRHLGADLYLVHWLDTINVSVDVIGDEDVDEEGYELLRQYATVITGSHPEYVTGREIDAADEYVNRGGRLMYMGGNGFYWVTSRAPGASNIVEVRRGHAGTRAWEPEPGQQHHQFTGEPGGLWRHRGWAPHALVGVGFVAEGWDGENRHYERQPASFRPEGAWAFEGIDSDEPIGEEGLVMGGAAGDEIDSADRALGTPAETLVLASSSGHSDAYCRVVEDALTGRDLVRGSQDPHIRADVTLTPKRDGGAVFAVGSISWTGCLSHHDYENRAARLSENVLRAFAAGASPWLPGAGGGQPAGE